MKRLILLVTVLNSLNADKVYKLLPSTHKYKIVVKETEHITISGEDSAGHCSRQHFTQSRERYMAPEDALDIAIRYESISILREALRKLKIYNETVDTIAALNIINYKLQEADATKKSGYWFSGIGGLFSVLLLLNSKSISTDNVMASSMILGMAGIVALASQYKFKRTIRKYAKIACMLLKSPVCITKNKVHLRGVLDDIQSLLKKNLQCKLAYLNN